MTVRDPHEPVVPETPRNAGEIRESDFAQGTHASMPIHSGLRDPHEPVLPEEVKLTQVPVPQRGEQANEAPMLPSAGDLDVVEADKDVVEGVVEAATSGLGALHEE